MRSRRRLATLLVISAATLACIGCGGSPPAADSSGESNAKEEATIPEEYQLGVKVYESKCELCHDKGEEGAPRLGNPLQWSDRVAKGEETLTKNAFDGFEGNRGEMPPQGEKFSLDEVQAAVRYMIYCYEQKAQDQ